MQKKIEVCIGTDRAGCVRARLSLMVVEGDQVLSEQFHSISIPPGGDAAELRRINEANIADPASGIPGAPWPAIPDEEWAKVTATLGVFHTPKKVQAWNDQQSALGAEQ